jgi:hypothetical protein
MFDKGAIPVRDIYGLTDPSRQLDERLPLSHPLSDRVDDAEDTIIALSARIADLELRREVSESVFSMLLALFLAGRTDRAQVLAAVRSAGVTVRSRDETAAETARLKGEQFVQELVDRIERILRPNHE